MEEQIFILHNEDGAEQRCRVIFNFETDEYSYVLFTLIDDEGHAISDVTALRYETDENGDRVYNFGAILNYLFNVDLLYRIKDKKLPIHIVNKKIEHIDYNGIPVKPTEVNGHKFEMLCVDMIELSDSCVPFEVIREKEFAPIKNKTGVDSVESAQALLEKNGYEL